MSGAWRLIPSASNQLMCTSSIFVCTSMAAVVLAQDDLVYAILRQLGPINDVSDPHSTSLTPERKHWRTLAACASISTLFHEHTLRVLWRELPSILPLLRLLPYLERVGPGGDDEARYKPWDVEPRPPLWQIGDRVRAHPKHLERFKLYEPHVKFVHVSVSDGRIDHSVFAKLCRHVGSDVLPLTPNVRRIVISRTPYLWQFVSALGGEALRGLHIRRRSPMMFACSDSDLASAITPLMWHLCHNCRKLEALQVPEGTEMGWLATLKALRRLTVISESWNPMMMSTPDVVLLGLSKLPDLTELTIRADIAIPNGAAITPGTFRELRVLTLNGRDSIGHVRRFFDTVGPLTLRELTLDECGYHSFEEISTLR